MTGDVSFARACYEIYDISDPGFHIAPLFIRLNPILAEHGLVAVIGKMTC